MHIRLWSCCSFSNKVNNDLGVLAKALSPPRTPIPFSLSVISGGKFAVTNTMLELAELSAMC